MLNNIESKVYASVVGTGAGGVVSAFVLWLLGVLAWGADADANAAGDAIAAVPVPVAGIVGLFLTVAGAAIGGYLAAHTDRPDLEDPTLPDVVEGGADAGTEAGEVHPNLRPYESSN